MQIVIIEDELPAARRLEKLLLEMLPDCEVVGLLDTVEDAVLWFQENAAPDLCFMDIQLADGLSFEIFRRTKVAVPVVFTTAFDQYAVKAFRLNGLDYLLKPIEETELRDSVSRFQKMNSKGLEAEVIEALMAFRQQERRYRERFLIKVGEQLRFVTVGQVAWFQADSGYVNLGMQKGGRMVIDSSIDQLREELDPNRFFQINRKMIVSLESVGKIHTYLNSRLKLELLPDAGEEVIVSRDRVKGFKAWLDR